MAPVSASVPRIAYPELITYIFPDLNAVKYFQKEFEQLDEYHLIEYTKTSGIDIYLVEQWVNNRNIGTLISTYTGNSNNDVTVVKFTVSKKPSKLYPLRFQEYLNELMLNHAKIKQIETESSEDEFIFITNTTFLPSHLSLIPILGGDVSVIQDDFVINSNLKKLHCSGRSISLITPKISDANEDKFRQMYRIYNLNIPIKFAIRELVNLVQTSLFYFDLLDAKYCDGLLCNKTEEAITNWWNLIGLPHYNIKPTTSNGILPPRTVAAILSLVFSVKLRLQLFGGCDVPKDPFDFENFMISIGEFQRQVKLEKKWKLDIETLNKLLYITNTRFKEIDKKNKGYTKEFRKLTNVVKNTVQDRIKVDDVFDQSRFRDRLTNPNDVETLDLETLTKYVVGKAKRLWENSDHHRKYKFYSLKEALENTQRIKYEPRRGLNRMKLGLSKKKDQTPSNRPNANPTLSGIPKVDELLKIPSDECKSQPADKCAKKSKNIVDVFDKNLNRRNSFPFTKQEINLNLIELHKEQQEPNRNVRRRGSFSLLHSHNNDLITIERVSLTYLNDMENLIEFDKFKKWYQNEGNEFSNDRLARSYETLNKELNCLQNNYKQMEQSQAKLNREDLSQAVEKSMQNLTTSIDRLVYESRIVMKRINELEQSSESLNDKFKEQYSNRLNALIDNLIHLNKFHKAFQDPEEKRELIFKLTGDSKLFDKINKEKFEDYSFVRVFITFLWEMVMLIFQLFKFDRSKMNLDRIRETWGKLDPKRTYINRAYEFVGHDTRGTKGSIQADESTT